MRVLIVKTSSLGDIIHALPVLDYLHQVSPGLEIDWAVEEQFAGILDGNPLLSGVQVVRTRAWRRAPLAGDTRRQVAELRQTLRQRNYDLVFDIQGNLKSGLITWLSGGRERIGFTRENLQESVNMLFTTRQLPVRPWDRHITDRYLRLVSIPFGRDFQGMRLTSSIPTTAEDDAAAATLLATLSDGLTLLFHCGTTWQTKFWYDQGWTELGGRVLERFPDANILLSWGSADELNRCTEIAAGIGHGVRVLERHTLHGLVALMKKVDLVLGADTGPVHLAAAVGTPTVSLYRASDGQRSGPRGEQHVVIQAPMHCTRCFRTYCDQDDACRRSITVDMLMQGVEKLLLPSV